MKYKLLLLSMAMGTMAFTAQANAVAHCFADVQLSNGTQTINLNKNWDRRTNGKKWRQVLGNHRSECDNLAANYFNSIDFEAYARKNMMCGKITAQGTSWIGTSRKRGKLGPKVIEIECTNKPKPSADKSDYQYATKLICGKMDGQLTIPGTYNAAVNIHNPSYEDVDLRYKFAQAEAGKDGEISYFKDSKIGPDGAQYFNCNNIIETLNLPSSVDGFFVIESREPLDVVAYYTSGNGSEMTVDVETTKERKTLDNKQWSCGNIRADLAKIGGWRLGSGLATEAETITYNGTESIYSTGIYQQSGMDLWLSNQVDVNQNQKAGNYNYELDFCLCEGNGYPAGQANVTINALRADNSVQANIDGSSQSFVSNQNPHDATVPGSGSANVTLGGNHFIQLASNNTGSFHAVGLSGTISIQNGHMGSCKK